MRPHRGGRKGTCSSENVELICPSNKGKRLIGNNVSTDNGRRLQTKIVALPLL
jgi:hypothetical protein